jgi:hypothetical protein
MRPPSWHTVWRQHRAQFYAGQDQLGFGNTSQRAIQAGIALVGDLLANHR